MPSNSNSLLKRFPAGPYDVILCILQLAVIVGIVLLPAMHALEKSLAAGGLFILLLPHWAAKRSGLWWTLIGLGTAAALSGALILTFHR